MTTITLPRATVEQALAALEKYRKMMFVETGCRFGEGDAAITNLRAALAQQAEPDHETRAELAEQQVVQLAEERDHFRNLWQKAQEQAEPVQEPVEPVEPVAWMVYTEGGASAYVTDNPRDLIGAYRALPLYTAPPQRKPLTEEEIWQNNDIMAANAHCGLMLLELVTLVRAVEQVHGIKE